MRVVQACRAWLAPFPPCCLVCGREGETLVHRLCAACRRAMTRPAARCAACGRLLPAGAEPTPPPGPALGAVCRGCRLTPPPYRRVAQVGPYEGTLRWTVRRLKHRGESFLAHPLGRLLADAARALPPPDVVVPVPPAATHTVRRGFAPTLLLARAVVDVTAPGTPIAVRALRRHRRAPPQRGRDRAERRRNAATAYAPGDNRRVHGGRVWLVDDVLTTGATLEACTRLLLRMGARDVWCLAVAESRGAKRRRLLRR